MCFLLSFFIFILCICQHENSRQSQEHAQRILFQRAKFTNFIVNNYFPLPMTRDAIPTRRSAADCRSGLRGLLINVGNVVRLQVNYLSCSLLFFLLFFLFSPSSVILFSCNCCSCCALFYFCHDLQASCQPPSSFLRYYLNSNIPWTDFSPTLLVLFFYIFAVFFFLNKIFLSLCV